MSPLFHSLAQWLRARKPDRHLADVAGRLHRVQALPRVLQIHQPLRLVPGIVIASFAALSLFIRFPHFLAFYFASSFSILSPIAILTIKFKFISMFKVENQIRRNCEPTFKAELRKVLIFIFAQAPVELNYFVLTKIFRNSKNWLFLWTAYSAGCRSWRHRRTQSRPTGDYLPRFLSSSDRSRPWNPLLQVTRSLIGKRT